MILINHFDHSVSPATKKILPRTQSPKTDTKLVQWNSYDKRVCIFMCMQSMKNDSNPQKSILLNQRNFYSLRINHYDLCCLYCCRKPLLGFLVSFSFTASIKQKDFQRWKKNLGTRLSSWITRIDNDSFILLSNWRHLRTIERHGFDVNRM